MWVEGLGGLFVWLSAGVVVCLRVRVCLCVRVSISWVVCSCLLRRVERYGLRDDCERRGYWSDTGFIVCIVSLGKCTTWPHAGYVIS